MYKRTKFDNVIRMSDFACIPFDEANKDYQVYLKHSAEGCEVLPADNDEALVSI